MIKKSWRVHPLYEDFKNLQRRLPCIIPSHYGKHFISTVFGKYQYFYENEKGDMIDAIYLQYNHCWEICSPTGFLQEQERYHTMQEVEQRVKELLE
jgi:hypothetical protein